MHIAAFLPLVKQSSPSRGNTNLVFQALLPSGS